MGPESFYSNYAFAKARIGSFRSLVEMILQSGSQLKKQALWCQIQQIVSGLKNSLPFFQRAGKQCEVHTLIILYTGLLHQLNSS